MARETCIDAKIARLWVVPCVSPAACKRGSIDTSDSLRRCRKTSICYLQSKGTRRTRNKTIIFRPQTPGTLARLTIVAVARADAHCLIAGVRLVDAQAQQELTALRAVTIDLCRMRGACSRACGTTTLDQGRAVGAIRGAKARARRAACVRTSMERRQCTCDHGRTACCCQCK